MSVFKKVLKKNNSSKSRFVLKSFAAAALVLSSLGQESFAKGKSYVAIEPLTCDLVKVIALPSDQVNCLVDRDKDVHDLRITPKQAQLLNISDKVFTLGKEMTPTMKNWEKKSSTIVIGASVIDTDDHSSHDENNHHDDHSAVNIDKHDDHHGSQSDHGSGDFEWAGVFDLPAGTYEWSFARVDGEYADPAMKMVILPVSDIEESEKTAKKLLGSDDAIIKRNNDVLVSNTKAYKLTFDQRKDTTVFKISINKRGKYTFFTEHMPFEFEADEHFFKNVAGNDVEPIAQVPEEGGHHHHDHGGLDPHVWHDPHNIVKMGKIIANKLKNDISIFNRSDRKQITERFNAFDSIVEELDSWIVQQVSTIPDQNKVIVSKHKAMEYYGDAFGFKTLSLLDFLGESSSLRPQNIASILRELKEENVKTLFAEQIPPSKLLRNLSRQSSVPIANDQIFVDGLMLEGNTVSVAVHNTCTIVNSLGGFCDQRKGTLLEDKWNNLYDK